jgi:diguanylate cyclase (GGDEF)-like protein
MTDRARVESRVLAEMSALATAEGEYEDLIDGVLVLIEDIVVSPLLSLSVQEPESIRHYTRVAAGLEDVWVEEATAFSAEVAEHHLRHRAAPGARQHHLPVPPTWLVVFPVTTRSQRSFALALAAPRSLSVTPSEEHLMLRLARQAALVLDHALLVRDREELDSTDPLTGAGSARRLLEVLEYELLRHRHSGRELSLALVDIEGLDRINRLYGHQYGNHILQRLADLLGETVRPIDVVARRGADEFAVVLPEAGDDDAELLAEEIRERILSVEFAGGAIGVSVSVAQARAEEMLGAEDLLWRAEQMLDDAKRQNRSQQALRARSGLR